jgi:hypothetical protein
MNTVKKIIIIAISLPVALGIFYGCKHFAHVKCVEGSLELYFKNKYKDFKQIESVDVSWWNPFGSERYACTAKVLTASGSRDISFEATRATMADVMKDDWEVNMGFWGWLGDDYRIMNIKVK